MREEYLELNDNLYKNFESIICSVVSERMIYEKK